MAIPTKPFSISLTRTFDLPYLTDWFSVTLRWVLLLALSLVAVASGQFTNSLAAVLAIGAVWNVVNSTLVVFYRRFSFHRPVNVAVDFLISLLTFIFARDLMWPVSWSVIVSVCSASLYFGLRGSIAAGAALTLAQIIVLLIYHPDSVTNQYLGINLLGNVIFVLVLGLSSKKILDSVRHLYQQQIRQRKEVLDIARKQERDRVKAFYSLAETLSTSLDLGIVLKSTLDLSAAALGDENSPAAQMVGVVLLYQENQLVIGSGRHLMQSDIHHTFPAEEGVLHEAIKTSSPQQLNNPSKDSELGVLSSLEHCRSVLCLPMRSGMNPNGVMLFAHADPNYFSTARSELLEMVSHQAAIAIQNARLYEDLADEKKRIITAQQEATRKLATNLHDGPTQSVTNIALHINIARKLLESDLSGAADELALAEDLAGRTVQEIRHMLFTLRPLMLETEGLISALNNIAKNIRDIYQQKIDVEINPDVVEQMEPNTQTEVFYLVDEAVNNARKHARAENISINLDFLSQDNNFALLRISDNGIGFNLEEVKRIYEKRGSLGMINLYERANLVNGLLHIDTAPGCGTRVEIKIPLTPEARRSIQHLPKQEFITVVKSDPSRGKSQSAPPERT